MMQCETSWSLSRRMKSFGDMISLSAILLLLLAGLSGCGGDDGIRQYTVERIPQSNSNDLIPRAKSENPPAWFFKLTGPADEVLKQVVPFSQLVKSVIFDPQGNPHYDVPEGWTVSSGPPPRHQTIKIAETEPALEVTVSSLPGPTRGYDQYLLANLNRWRDQLGLEPYSNDENWIIDARSKGEITIVPLSSFAVVMVNLLGEMPEKGEQRILGAVVLLPPEVTTPVNPPQTPAAASKPPFEYKTPEGWKENAGNAMRLASFEVKNDAGIADVSVSRFPGGGDALANVNRWRGQVKLDPLTEEELEKSARKMDIGGLAGAYYEAVGPEQTILAAIVPDGDSKWFFKMQGPNDAVAAETSRFEEFLKSIKFEK